jgi:hypothetical protein
LQKYRLKPSFLIRLIELTSRPYRVLFSAALLTVGSVFLGVHVKALTCAHSLLSEGNRAGLSSFLKDQSTMDRSSDVQELLDLRRLEKNGFTIKNDKLGKSFLVDIKNGNRVVGELGRLDVPYLYEWKRQEYHDAWIKNGGISESEMKSILANRISSGQRGYFVSEHILDSENYGPALTIFPNSGPMLMLKGDGPGLMRTEQGALRLQAAGIDGMTPLTKTWHVIINSRRLQGAMRINRKVIAQAVKSEVEALSLAISYSESQLQKIRFWELIDQKHLVYRIQFGQKVSEAEMVRVGSFVSLKNFEALRQGQTKVAEFFFQKAVPAYVNSLLESQDSSLHAKAFQIINRYEVASVVAARFNLVLDHQNRVRMKLGLPTLISPIRYYNKGDVLDVIATTKDQSSDETTFGSFQVGSNLIVRNMYNDIYSLNFVYRFSGETLLEVTPYATWLLKQSPSPIISLYRKMSPEEYSLWSSRSFDQLGRDWGHGSTVVHFSTDKEFTSTAAPNSYPTIKVDFQRDKLLRLVQSNRLWSAAINENGVSEFVLTSTDLAKLLRRGGAKVID